MYPRRHNPALGTAVVKINRLHLDPAAAQRQVDRIDYPIPGHLKITLAASRREPLGSNTARGPSSMDA
jgi:hypothetical protein